MRVGVITWFTYENYGTKLQAIALQRYLINKGIQSELVNFQPPQVCIKDTSSFSTKVVNKIKYYVEKLGKNIYKHQLSIRSQRLNSIIPQLCVLTDAVNCDESYASICNKFDYLITGSDQIWNPNWLHPYYYAAVDGVKTQKIAYAPSIGVNKIPESVQDTYRNYLESFKSIGIREKSGKHAVSKLYSGFLTQVVDPTLLLTAEEWNKCLGLKNEYMVQDYVCVYYLGDNVRHWRAVREFAREKNLRVVIIPQIGQSYLKKGEIHADAGVKEFVELIRDARYVVTDSFHATVFSIIYQKDFFVFERFSNCEKQSQNARIKDFLDDAGLLQRILPYNTANISEYDEIEYKIVNSKLNVGIEESKHFIELALKE